MDQVNINELGMRHKLEEEIKRYNKFQSVVLGGKGKQDPAEAELVITLISTSLDPMYSGLEKAIPRRMEIKSFPFPNPDVPFRSWKNPFRSWKE